MGRELKRVPLDFKWEIGKLWCGYVNPHTVHKCNECDGSRHFAITKERLMMRSRDFYKKIVDILLEDQNAPWMIERLECYIFNKNYKAKY